VRVRLRLQTTVTNAPAYGYPPAGTDLEAHLPSSSHALSDINKGDSFDLGSGSANSGPVKGNDDAPGVGLGRKGAPMPEIHMVNKGDTLWDLCAAYFGNPWMWPTLWSQNPQLQNPHWIYPGDQLRLRAPGEMPVTGPAQSLVLGSGQTSSTRKPMVPRSTVFLRNMGYIDDPDQDIWGEIVGAEEEQQLLTEGNNIYMMMRPGVALRVGQQLSVFRTSRKIEKIEGARMPPGQIVAFKGTVKITRWNPTTRMATGQLTESLDIMERGAKIGQVGRRFDVVPPKPSAVDVQARVLTGMYPHEIMGKDQVVFIDRGSNDGLVAGNRLVIIRRGDTWRKTLPRQTEMVRTTIRLDDPDHAPLEVTPLGGKDADFPTEIVGEIRILRAQKWSSLALVVQSQVEIEPGDRAVSRKGQ